MENTAISKLILAFVVLIVGVSLIGTVSQQTNSAIDLLGVANETFAIGTIGQGMVADGCSGGSINDTHYYTLANAPGSDWRANGGCAISRFRMRNQSNIQVTSATDYIFHAANGTFFLVNGTGGFVEADCSGAGTPTNVTAVEYQYCPLTYLNLGWGRSVLTLVAGFFALALLGASVGLFYSVAKDSGIL